VAAGATANRQRRAVQHHLPASFVREAVAQRPHVVANGGPFRAADDANVLDREDGKEQVLVGPVIPVLVHGCCVIGLLP